MDDLPQNIISTLLIFLIMVLLAPSGVVYDESDVLDHTILDIDQVEVTLIADAWVTAYSSTPEETWGDPFITASGERVRDGIIAANFLPFGTEVMIPEIYGDKVFVVKDRMHRRKKNFVDIWMPSKQKALNFGIHETQIKILDEEIALTGLDYPYELPEFALY